MATQGPAQFQMYTPRAEQATPSPRRPAGALSLRVGRTPEVAPSPRRLEASTPPPRRNGGDNVGESPEKGQRATCGWRALEIRGGQKSGRPEIDGAYALLQDSWAGAPMYRNRKTKVFLLWCERPASWRIVREPGSAETFAYVSYAGAHDAPPQPWEVGGPWTVIGRFEDASDGSFAEIEETCVECVFLGQTVVVSGRSGHNQRLNGVFTELPEGYGGLPAYRDTQKHLFLYRRQNPAAWVISNRLGPSIRSGRGIVFAEVEDEAQEPWQVRRPWRVNAWGNREAEEDPGISVFLRAEGGKEGPPPVDLTVRSAARPEVSGNYSLHKACSAGRRINSQVFYLRVAEGPGWPDRYLFWDGERWCIGSSVEARGRECDACSQRRDVSGRNHPDDAIWQGVEVLRGTSKHIDAELLSSLRGRISSVSKHFSG